MQRRVSQPLARAVCPLLLSACAGSSDAAGPAPSQTLVMAGDTAQTGAPNSSAASAPAPSATAEGTNTAAAPLAPGASVSTSPAEPLRAEPGPVPEAPGPRFIGRFDFSDPAGPRFAWSGTGIVANFSGTALEVRLSGGQEYTVLVDGVLQPKLLSSGGFDSVAQGLAEGIHRVELYRRTEASLGEAQFLGFSGAELLAPPLAAERRIEIVGDSISCGYGNEGPDMSCGFTPGTENHYLTYGAIAAREVGAELTTIAWSGKGVVCNYGDDALSCTEPLPDYYDRILPNRPDSRWD